MEQTRVVSRISSVSIVTSLRASGWSCDFFFSPPRPEWFLGPLSLLCSGSEDSFPAVNRPGRGAEHSLPSSASVELYLNSTIRPHGVALN